MKRKLAEMNRSLQTKNSLFKEESPKETHQTVRGHNIILKLNGFSQSQISNVIPNFNNPIAAMIFFLNFESVLFFLSI